MILSSVRLVQLTVEVRWAGGGRRAEDHLAAQFSAIRPCVMCGVAWAALTAAIDEGRAVETTSALVAVITTTVSVPRDAFAAVEPDRRGVGRAVLSVHAPTIVAVA